MSMCESPFYATSALEKHTHIPELWGKKDESEIVLTIVLLLWRNNHKTLYVFIFKISTICSKHQADSPCVKYVQKTNLQALAQGLASARF